VYSVKEKIKTTFVDKVQQIVDISLMFFSGVLA